jgi:hypothetical protein
LAEVALYKGLAIGENTWDLDLVKLVIFIAIYLVTALIYTVMVNSIHTRPQPCRDSTTEHAAARQKLSDSHVPQL